jgi:hypothetical protein
VINTFRNISSVSNIQRSKRLFTRLFILCWVCSGVSQTRELGVLDGLIVLDEDWWWSGWERWWESRMVWWSWEDVVVVGWERVGSSYLLWEICVQCGMVDWWWLDEWACDCSFYFVQKKSSVPYHVMFLLCLWSIVTLRVTINLSRC